MKNVGIACSDRIKKFKDIWQRDNPQMMPNGICVKLKFKLQHPYCKEVIEYMWVKIVSSDKETKTYVSYMESESVNMHICFNTKIEFTHDEIIEASFKYDLLNYIAPHMI
jgi:hypothetical protein